MRRCAKMSNDLFEKIRKQQELINRLRPPDVPILRLLESIQLPHYGIPLTKIFDTINLRSDLFEETQSILTRPAILEQLKALTTASDTIQRQVNRALLPERHVLGAIAGSMAKEVALFRTAGIEETAWSKLLERQMAAVRMPWGQRASASAVV